MKILNADHLMSGLYTYRIDRQFFNEFINYMGGCSEYFSTTSDETDSDDEKAMFQQHAIEIRSLQSNILSRAAIQNGRVLFGMTEGEQSALFYNLISMLASLPEGWDATDESSGIQLPSGLAAQLPEEPPFLAEVGGYLQYPLYNAQFSQILLSLNDLLRDLNLILDSLDSDNPESHSLYLNIEKRRDSLIELQGEIMKNSYVFQDSDTGRTMTAMVIAQPKMLDLFRALLSVTTITYGKTDFSKNLPEL